MQIPDSVDPVLHAADVLVLRKEIDAIYIDDKIKRYIVDLVHATRRPKDCGLELNRFVQYGASPRATIFLTRGSKGQAFLQGRAYVTPEDVKTIAMDVLRHRVSLTYEAEAEDVSPESIVQQILDQVKVP